MAIAERKQFQEMTESFKINIEIANHSRLLAGLSYASEPVKWADAQLKMAELIIREYEIKGSANLDDAANNCKNALRVFDKSNHPQKWARTQFIYATVFLYKSYQLIPALSHSLKKMEETAIGRTAQMLLGYTEQDDIEQAVSRFWLALDVFDKQKHPTAWAYANMGLGDAYATRLEGETIPNKNEMIRAFENALTIFTPAANVHENIAIHEKYGKALVMYSVRQGTDGEEGIKHFHFAAEGWRSTADETKLIHVYTNYNFIGDTYFFKHEWDKASGAYNEGLACITRIISFGYSNELKGAQAEGIIAFVFHYVFTLYKQQKYDEALLLIEHARNAKNLGKDSAVFGKDKIKQVLGMIPPNTIVVIPIITELGAFVFILPHGKSQVTANEVIPMDKLTNNVLQEILLGTKNGENGWLTTYAEWLEERDLKRWKWEISRHLEWIGDAVMDTIVSFLLDLDREKKCEIVLVPSRGLSLIPLHAASGTANSNGSLIEHFAVSYVNNLDELFIANKKSKQFTNDDISLLSIINPTLDKNLAHTEQENKAIQSFFKKRRSYVLYGADAKKEKVLESISKYTYIHFACHGNYDWQEPEKSYLLIAQNQKIRVEEIQKAKKINCRLICLAACETSMANFRNTVDANSGFPNAFLAAGATGVISPLWEVDDESTALLMKELYHHHLVGQMPPAQALRQAQLELRNMFIEDKELLSERMGFRGHGERSYEEIASMLLDESNEGKKFTHEFFWAAFVLWGC